MANAITEALKAYAARNNLRAVRSDEFVIGTARVVKRSGKFVVETTVKATSPYLEVGYEYPAGVRGLTEADMVAWLNAH